MGCRAEKEAEKEKAKQEKEAARKEKEVASGKHCDLQLSTITDSRFHWCLVCGPAALQVCNDNQVEWALAAMHRHSVHRTNPPV